MQEARTFWRSRGVLIASGLAITALAHPQFPASRPSRGLELVPEGAIALLEADRLAECAGGARLARLLGAPAPILEGAWAEGPATAALYLVEGGRLELLLVLPDSQGAETLLRSLGKGEDSVRAGAVLAGNQLTEIMQAMPWGPSLHYMRRGGHLAAATSRDLLGRCLAAEVSPATASALAETDLARAREDAGGGGSFFFCRGELLEFLPVELAGLLAGVDRLHWASPGTAGGRERLRLVWSSREPLLARVLSRRGPGPAEQTGPAGSVGVALMLDGAALAEEQSPAGALLEVLSRATGLPWREIGPALAGPASLCMTSQGRLARLVLSDPDRVDRILRGVFETRGDGSESVAAGYTITSITTPIRISWSLAGETLFLAESPEALSLGLQEVGRAPLPEGKSLRAWGQSAELARLLGLDAAGLPALGVLELEASLEPDGLSLSLALEGAGLLAALARPGAPGPEPSTERDPPARETARRPVASRPPDPGARARFDSLVALEESGQAADFMEEIVALLADPEPSVAARAAYVLGQARVPGSAGALAKALRDSSDPLVRRYAAYALMRVPEKPVEHDLVKALNDEDAGVRGFAATALEKLGARAAARHLADALVAFPEGSTESRIRILRALAEAGDPAFIPRVLVSVSGKEPLDLLNAMVYSLQRMTPALGPREPDLLAAMLDHPSIHVRRYAVERLGELGGSSGEAPLLRRLEVEGPVLAPRIKVSLEAIAAANRATTAVKGVVDKVAGKVLTLREKAMTFAAGVREWPDWKKGLLAALPLLFGALLLIMRSMIRRAGERRRARRLAALVAPSHEYAEEGIFAEEPLAEPEPSLESSEDLEQLSAFPGLSGIEPGEEVEQGFEMEELPDLEIDLSEPAQEPLVTEQVREG